MTNGPPYYELLCPACGQREVCSLADLAVRLRRLGMLKRQKDPDAELLQELFREAAPRLSCTDCAAIGLSFSIVDDDEGGAWLEARLCRGCQTPLAKERLELFPDARLCAACQEKELQRGDDEQAEYCPHCGSIMLLRLQSSGISRYILQCPACGNRSLS